VEAPPKQATGEGRSHTADVVVIGSGIGGLSCAALLARYGYQVRGFLPWPFLQRLQGGAERRRRPGQQAAAVAAGRPLTPPLGRRR
jgi:glycine/D-amino acid oxidase-like deaminating enzyme